MAVIRAAAQRGWSQVAVKLALVSLYAISGSTARKRARMPAAICSVTPNSQQKPIAIARGIVDGTCERSKHAAMNATALAMKDPQRSASLQAVALSVEGVVRSLSASLR